MDVLHTVARIDESPPSPLRLLPILPPLAEFFSACSTVALSIDQRAFLAQLLLLFSTLLTHSSNRLSPTDIPVAQHACRAFVDACVRLVELTCADPHAAGKLADAQRALAAVVILCADVDLPQAELTHHLGEMRSALGRPSPKFDEVASSSQLQAALARYRAVVMMAAKSEGGGTVAQPQSALNDPISDALSFLFSPDLEQGASSCTGSMPLASKPVWQVASRNLNFHSCLPLLHNYLLSSPLTALRSSLLMSRL